MFHVINKQSFGPDFVSLIDRNLLRPQVEI